MGKYEHISEMEAILNNHSSRIRELDETVEYLKNNIEDFNRLVDYYHSEQRQEDLRADDNGLIEEKLKRGVLSEDAIYDLISDYYQTCVNMLELSTSFFKHN